MKNAGRHRATACLAVGMLLLAGALQGQTRKKPSKPDPFLTGPPWSFEEVMKGVADLFPARLQAVIEARGINFFPTRDQEKQLRDAGASEGLIELMERKGATFKPPPPKPKPTTAGTLTLRCAPAECSIAINGKPIGQTRGGVKLVEGWVIGPSGSATVDFKKDGYLGQQVSIPLKVGVAASKAVTLEPTRALQEKFGHDVLNALVKKLGGSAGWHDAGLLRASGRATLFPGGNQHSSEWNVDARLNASAGMAYLEISGAGFKKWWISLKGSDSKTGGDGKIKGSQIAIEMEKMVRQYRDFQLCTLLSRIVDQKMTPLASPPLTDTPSEVTLKALSVTGSYTLTIQPNGLPSRAVYESASGLGSGLSVVYGDYVSVGKAALPRVMDIRFADQAQHGMEFHFDTITTAPNLPDKEFHR